MTDDLDNDTVTATYGLINIPGRRLLIIDADRFTAEALEMMSDNADSIVALVAGRLAEVWAELDERERCYRIVIDVLREAS